MLKSGASSDIIYLPKIGVAIQGIGETFSPDLFTGIQEPTGKPRWKPILEAAGVAECKRLLNAGCGAGRASLFAVQHTPQIKGLSEKPIFSE